MSKLLRAAVKLYHKKEWEAFEDMYTALCTDKSPPKRKGANVNALWFWGLKRWKKLWPEIEYRTHEDDTRELRASEGAWLTKS